MEEEDIRLIRKVAANLVEIGLPPKPRFTSACNGCGLCCMLELCPVARSFYGPEATAPCPSFVMVDGRGACAFVQTEVDLKLEPKVQMVLGIGLGCGMRDEDTTDAEVEDFHERNKLKLVSAM